MNHFENFTFAANIQALCSHELCKIIMLKLTAASVQILSRKLQLCYETFHDTCPLTSLSYFRFIVPLKEDPNVTDYCEEQSCIRKKNVVCLDDDCIAITFNRENNTSIKIFIETEHSDFLCSVCTLFSNSVKMTDSNNNSIKHYLCIHLEASAMCGFGLSSQEFFRFSDIDNRMEDFRNYSIPSSNTSITEDYPFLCNDAKNCDVFIIEQNIGKSSEGQTPIDDLNHIENHSMFMDDLNHVENHFMFMDDSFDHCALTENSDADNNQSILLSTEDNYEEATSIDEGMVENITMYPQQSDIQVYDIIIDISEPSLSNSNAEVIIKEELEETMTRGTHFPDIDTLTNFGESNDSGIDNDCSVYKLNSFSEVFPFDLEQLNQLETKSEPMNYSFDTGTFYKDLTWSEDNKNNDTLILSHGFDVMNENNCKTVMKQTSKRKGQLTRKMLEFTHTKRSRESRKSCYNCRVCGKDLKSSCNLITHMRIHTGERPYVCRICQFAFKQYVHLANHIKIHTGERPHGCKLCPASFIQSSALKTHVKNIHENPNRKKRMGRYNPKLYCKRCKKILGFE